jgi:SAM-dependent methyltransferase
VVGWSAVEHAAAITEPPLRAAWEGEAEAWATWARTPGHDWQFWEHNLPDLLALVPPPGRLTLDAGCGEGRVGRELAARGHQVVGVDGSPTLARLAGAVLGDLSALPFPDGVADLVVSHMVLQDVDDLDATMRELARVLDPAGTLCAVFGHPMSMPRPDGTPYRTEVRTATTIERGGLRMTFHTMARPLEAYGRAFEAAGLAITTIREPALPGEDLPWFLQVRAVPLRR